MSIRLLAIVIAVLIGGCTGGKEAPKGDPEARIVAYLMENVRPGEAIFVTDLYNKVFTSREEQQVLDRLTDAFFKIPATAAQIHAATGKIPSLQELSGLFEFKIPGEIEILLKIMDYDPRMPKLLERDPATGEITSIDVDRIASEARFRRPLANPN